MKLEDAEKLSALLLQMRVNLDQSIGFVKERSTKNESEEYTNAVADVMGHLIWHLIEPLWEKHPELKPEEQGGTYKVDPSIYENIFNKKT